LLQDATDLSVHFRLIEGSLGTRDAGAKTCQRGFDLAAKFVVDRSFFVAPFDRATEDGIFRLRAAGEFDLDSVADLAPAVDGCEL
jgi:hypothetical protein